MRASLLLRDSKCLFKFCDYIKLIATFLGLRHVKRRSAFSFKLNLVSKTVAALFSEINPDMRISFRFAKLRKKHSYDRIQTIKFLIEYG